MAAEVAEEAIFGAAEEGDVEGVARMLDEDPLLLTVEWNGDSLLIQAAVRGHVGVVRLLLERGADANATNDLGKTPLHYVARSGHEEVVSLLLSSGADPSRTNNFGRTALYYASESGHVAVVRLLLRHMGGRGLDERDEDGFSALLVACLLGHADVVRALLLAGADHTVTFSNGETLVQVAQEKRTITNALQ